MSPKAKISALAISLAIAMPAAATTIITNADGPHAFTGFDWAQGGTAFATGFAPTTGTNFSLTYFAYATNLVNGFLNISPLPGFDTVADGISTGYEYTIVANLAEKVNGCVGTVCNFAVNSGTWTIYYDTTADANASLGALGTGFANGTPIMSGTINPLASSTFDISSGANSTTVTGQVTFTNGAFVAPPFTNTTATTTLQLGNAITSWVNPGGFNGVAFTPNDNPIFQADGNQSFTTTVPEPGTLALLGLGLGAFGWTLRRRGQV